MSSLVLEPVSARRAAGRAPRAGRLSRILTDHGADLMLGVVVAAFAIVLLVDVPHDYGVDSWLALVDGRAVWQSGIPHRDLFNAMTYGHRWTDEQWLSQLASYAIFRLGGLGLLGAANVALMVGSIGALVALARRQGASLTATLVAIPLCVALISPSREIRTQGFAMPLFTALVWLLVTDARRSSRRVLWCLPLLVLWANLHGSATQGATLVVLYAGCDWWRRCGERRPGRSTWIRPLGLAAGAVAAILITPYGTSILGYYHETMVNPTLREFVSEWQPVTSKGTSTVALCLLMGLALWSFGRRSEGTTAWEKLALLLLAAGTIDVIRNALFLGLLGLVVVPLSLTGTWPGARRDDDASAGTEAPRGEASPRVRAVLNGMLVLGAALGVVVAAIAAVAQPASAIRDAGQSPRMMAAVRHAVAADPALRIIADDRFSDYLLWRDPALAGHVAADVRFELLTPSQLDGLESVFNDTGAEALSAAHGYRLLVLDRQVDHAGAQAFAAEPGSKVLYRDPTRIVILRSAAEAARS